MSKVYTREQLEQDGYIEEACRNCNGTGKRVPPKNPAKGEIECKKCQGSGRVWLDTTRIKDNAPIGSIRKLIARDIVGVG